VRAGLESEGGAQPPTNQTTAHRLAAMRTRTLQTTTSGAAG
jgi:hypothetical protein